MAFLGTSFLRYKRLRAEAMVTHFSMGSKLACCLNSSRNLTSGLEEFDIGFAVNLHLSLHDKVVIGIDLLLVATVEFGFLFGRHAIRIVHVFGWHGSFVMLIFLGVEFVWE